MFERFTDRARRVVVLAQEEARLLNHNYIGTEHILLGLVHEGEGVAARALTSLDISLEAVRAQVNAIIGRGGQAPSGHIPFTPRAKKVLELSLRESMQLGHNYIGTEHVLLGLIREGEGVAAQVLVNLGADLSVVRQRVVKLLSGVGQEAVPPESRRPPVLVQASPLPAAYARNCSFCGRDEWDVERFVEGASAIICDVCIAAANSALDSWTGEERAVPLPPRGFGDPPPETEQLTEIQAGLLAGLDGDVEHIEDGPRLAPLRGRARAARPGFTVRHVIQRVRMIGPDRAEFRCVFHVQPGGGAYPFEGVAIREDGRWKVSRDTILGQLRLSGISLDDP